MQTKLAPWATSLLTLVGVVLVGAFFLAWITDGTSGLGLAWDGERWLFLVPLAGLALAATAITGSRYTRLAAIVAGVLVAGDLTFDLLKGLLHGGPDLWCMLGGAGLVLAGIGEKNKGLRGVGGLAVLVGFFAPWTGESTFRMLISEGADMAAAFGISVRVLWLIPVAGLAAVASTARAGAAGKRVAAIAGVAVYGSLLWMIGSVANLIFAWGAWITLGASATALALGVLAPGAGATKAPAVVAKQA